jgi:hypothetical protein
MTRKFCTVFVASLVLGCTQPEVRTDGPATPALHRSPIDWPGSMMNRWPVTGSIDRPGGDSLVGRVVEPAAVEPRELDAAGSAGETPAY